MKNRHLQAIQFLFSREIPHLILFVTSGCNLRCRHCFYWEQTDRCVPEKELSVDEITRISKGFGALHYLTITGGEPLLRNDLLSIVRVFYVNNRLKHLSVHTNGSFPEKTEALARQLIREFPGMVVTFSLSLDHIGDKHDEIRGKTGVFDLLIRTIQGLKPLLEDNPDLDINISTVFSAYNQNDILRIHDHVEHELGCRHAVGLVRGRVRCQEALDVDMASYRRIADHMETIEARRRHRFPFSLTGKLIDQVVKDVVIRTVREKRMILPCLAGKKAVVIRQDGEVFPCELLDRSYGNIRDFGYDIDQVLKTKAAAEVNQFIKAKKCFCTFECALPLAIIHSPKGWYWLLKKYLKYSCHRLQSTLWKN